MAKEKAKKQKPVKVKKTKQRTAQQTIPYTQVYPDGMIMLEPGLFCKSYAYENINFETETEDRQEELLKSYGKLLNKFGPNVLVQFNIFNRKTSQANLENKFFIKPKADALNEYREEYNQIVDDRIKEGRNDIRKERYITLTLRTSDIIMANKTFNTLDAELAEAMKEINKIGVKTLSTEERLCILHDIFRGTGEDYFSEMIKKYRDSDGFFSLEKLAKTGATTKDLIAPSAFVNSAVNVRLGENLFAKTFIITDLPTSMETKFLSEITNIPCEMLTSVIYRSLPRKKAIKIVKTQSNSIKGEVIKANQQAFKNNYDPSLISEDLMDAREEASYLVKDVTINNQKLFFVTITITLLAESLAELKEFSDILNMRAADFMCQADPLYGQQLLGLKTTLPLGQCFLAIDRMLNTESTGAFCPFSVQELMDENGHFYGLNAVTKNMILYNRRTSPLPNGLIFGQSGSGKSFLAKGEIIPNLLDTEDDIIILDPDGEYVAIAKEFGGTVIELAQGADIHINPLDMDMDYSEKNEDPVALKCDHLVTLCESIMGKRDPLTPYDVNTIHKCGKIIYEDYVNHMEDLRKAGSDITCDKDASPTLVTFYNALNDMGTPEAHRLAMALEPYCVGNYNMFAHRTSIKSQSRFIVYDLRKLPKKMKEFAMKVCLSDIWNRVCQNRLIKKATWVYLDEFYLLVQTESSAATIQEYYKRIRKYFGIMTGITQDIEDVLVTPEGRGILNNSGFIIMMNQSQIGRAELQNQFNISPSLMGYIKDRPPGEGLIYNGQSIVPFNYRLPTDSKLYKLMSTKPSED